MKLTKTIAKKVLKIVDAGLVNGLGVQKEGKMCIEAAVCFAMGLPHGDHPPCVGSAVRSFKISLNDSHWPTDEDRTRGMRKLAIAQLGSDALNQLEFTKKLGFRCITTVLPAIVENAITEDKDNDFCKKQNKKLKPLIEQLKSAKDFEEAKKLAQKVWEIYASASAFTYASASAAFTYASASAAFASAFASASAASTSTSAFTYASAAFASAFASFASASFASASTKKNKIFSLKVLNLIAQAGLDTLIEMKSEGTKWLDLCETRV